MYLECLSNILSGWTFIQTLFENVGAIHLDAWSLLPGCWYQATFLNQPSWVLFNYALGWLGFCSAWLLVRTILLQHQHPSLTLTLSCIFDLVFCDFSLPSYRLRSSYKSNDLMDNSLHACMQQGKRGAMLECQCISNIVMSWRWFRVHVQCLKLAEIRYHVGSQGEALLLSPGYKRVWFRRRNLTTTQPGFRQKLSQQHYQ
jgi:hypothetical protein